jgi:hypothetical protein
LGKGAPTNFIFQNKLTTQTHTLQKLSFLPNHKLKMQQKDPATSGSGSFVLGKKLTASKQV